MCRARWRRAAPACASDVRARARPRPQKNAKACELENWEKARAKLKGMCEPPPHERDLNEMSEGLLFIAELGKEDYLEEMTHQRFPVLLTEHFKNSVIVSNVLYCIGASALASFEKVANDLPQAQLRGPQMFAKCSQIFDKDVRFRPSSFIH